MADTDSPSGTSRLISKALVRIIRAAERKERIHAAEAGSVPPKPSPVPIPVEILAGRIRHEPKGRFVSGGRVEADCKRGSSRGSRPAPLSSEPRSAKPGRRPAGKVPAPSPAPGMEPSSPRKYVRTAAARAAAAKNTFPPLEPRAPSRSRFGKAAAANAVRHKDAPRKAPSSKAASERFAPTSKASGFGHAQAKRSKITGPRPPPKSRNGNPRGRNLKPRRK